MPAVPPMKTTVCPRSSGSCATGVTIVAVLIIPPINSLELRCAAGKAEIVFFDCRVAGEAGFHESGVGWFAIHEVTEPPCACGGVICRGPPWFSIRCPKLGWGCGEAGQIFGGTISPVAVNPQPESMGSER